MTVDWLDPDVLDMVGWIYDAAVQPQLWWPVLDRIREHFGFCMAALGASALPSGAAVLRVTANIPEGYAAALPRYGEAMVALWGGVSRIAELPIEEPVLTTLATNPADWPGNPFYTEWVRPLGIDDQVAIFLARDRTMIGHLGLSVHESAPRPTERTMQALRFLAPHIRRSVTISRLLDVSDGFASTFEAALEASRTGIVLVAEDLSIVFANQSAQTMLSAGDPIRRTGERLSIRQEFAQGKLREAVSLASGDEARLGRHGIALPAQRRDGTPLAVHVMPLRRRPLRGAVEARAVAAVFIADAGGPPSLPADAVGLLFGLTPAEARVFELVVAGRSTNEAARILAIAPSTMRTHLLSVFAKTGRRNRADLVRLSSEVALPG